MHETLLNYKSCSKTQLKNGSNCYSKQSCSSINHAVIDTSQTKREFQGVNNLTAETFVIIQ